MAGPKLQLLGEMWRFVKARKKYWLIPLLLVLFLLGGLLVFAESSVVAPFIYTVF